MASTNNIIIPGVVTANPTAGQLLCTSGALNYGGVTGTNVLLQPILTTITSKATFKIQLWNGTAEVGSFNITCPADDTRYEAFSVPIPVPNGHFVRVLNSVLIASGSVQATLMLSIDSTY